MIEHGAYRKLLDYLYATEKPLPLDNDKILRVIGCKSVPEKAVVLQILKEFFIKTRSGWTHKRFLKELKHVNQIRYRNRENGKKGGRPRKKEKPSGNPAETDWVNLGNPNETQNNQTLDSRLLDSRLQTPETPVPSALNGGERARVAITAVAAEEGTNGNRNGKHPAPTTATLHAFRALGHQPFGTKAFQAKWTERYSEAGNDPNWTDIMELTIQECDDNRIKIPGLFYKHKHEIENGEVKMRYKVTPQ